MGIVSLFFPFQYETCLYISLWDEYLEEKDTHTVFILTYGLSSRVLTKGQPLRRAAPRGSRQQTARPGRSAPARPTPRPRRAHCCTDLPGPLDRAGEEHGGQGGQKARTPSSCRLSSARSRVRLILTRSQGLPGLVARPTQPCPVLCSGYSAGPSLDPQ